MVIMTIGIERSNIFSAFANMRPNEIPPNTLISVAVVRRLDNQGADGAQDNAAPRDARVYRKRRANAAWRTCRGGS
jgi:hypothetical protein